ncbi:hypothetical protein [Streptomyces sp. HUAS TT7]|uniref:hypothetical protein n=1 Tax=Streptomyces sp. HUAS TT7 TaxID=3447507 RepID=UPI003F65729A
MFSAYALTLLGALLTAGTLSDHLGRRPVLIGALLAEVAAMAAFATAQGITALIAARILQSLATGRRHQRRPARLRGPRPPRTGRPAPAAVPGRPGRTRRHPHRLLLLSCLAMSIPAVLAGLLPNLYGLQTAVFLYTVTVSLLALTGLVRSVRQPITG